MVDLYCSQASAGTCSRDGLVPAWARREMESFRCAVEGVDDEEENGGSEGRGGFGGGDIGPGVGAAAGTGLGVGACAGVISRAEACVCVTVVGFRGGNRGLGGFAGAFPLAALAALGLNSRMN